MGNHEKKQGWRVGGEAGAPLLGMRGRVRKRRVSGRAGEREAGVGTGADRARSPDGSLA